MRGRAAGTGDGEPVAAARRAARGRYRQLGVSGGGDSRRGERRGTHRGGQPGSDSATPPVKPFNALTETVQPAVFPALTVRADGIAVRRKSGGAGTTSVAHALRLTDPLVPVMVSG